MKTHLKIATAASLITVTALFVATSKRSSALESQVESIRVNRSQINPQDGSVAFSDTTAVNVPTIAQLLEIVPETAANDTESTQPLALIPAAVRLARKCDSTELLELALELLDDETLPKEKQQACHLFAMIYVLLAAEQAPEEALLFHEKHLREHPAGRDLESGILLALAKRDPDAAASRLHALPDDTRGERTKAPIIGTLLTEDLPLAIVLLEDSPDIAQRAAAHAGLGPEGAIALREQLGKISNPDIRTDVAVGLAGSVFVRDGYQEAYAFFDGIDESDPTVQAQTASELAIGFSNQSPRKALEFAYAELDGDLKTKTIASIAGKWAKQDFNAAGEWLGGLDRSPTRDAAIAQFALEVQSVDSEAASIWAKEISDPGLRDKTLESLGNR